MPQQPGAAHWEHAAPAGPVQGSASPARAQVRRALVQPGHMDAAHERASAEPCSTCHCSVDLYEPIEVHGLDVAELRRLPQLTVSLGIHAYYGTEAYVNYPDVEAGDHVGALPPLAGLHLTALMLIGNVFPPPDLGQLPHQRTLVLHHVRNIEWPEEKPWSAMAELACVEAIRTNLPGARALGWHGEFRWDAWPAVHGSNVQQVHPPLPPSVPQMPPCWLPPPAWPRCTPLAAQAPGVPSWRRCAPTCASRLRRRHRL